MRIFQNMMMVSGGGKPQLGIIAGGVTYLTANQLYNFILNTMTGTTALGLGRGGPMGTSNSSFGIIAGGLGAGGSTGYVDQYTYASASIANHTALTTARYDVAADGNKTTFGLYCGGYSGASYLQSTEVYTYATYAVTAGTNLTALCSLMGGAGNTLGMIIAGAWGGAQSTATNKYTYSGNTCVAGTALGTARMEPGAVGTGSIGYFAGSYSTSTAVIEKYTFSGDTRANGTSLSALRGTNQGNGCPTKAAFAGGFNGSSDVGTNDIYTFAGDVVTGGAALITATHSAGGASSSFA